MGNEGGTKIRPHPLTRINQYYLQINVIIVLIINCFVFYVIAKCISQQTYQGVTRGICGNNNTK